MRELDPKKTTERIYHKTLVKIDTNKYIDPSEVIGIDYTVNMDQYNKGNSFLLILSSGVSISTKFKSLKEIEDTLNIKLGAKDEQ